MWTIVFHEIQKLVTLIRNLCYITTYIFLFENNKLRKCEKHQITEKMMEKRNLSVF